MATVESKSGESVTKSQVIHSVQYLRAMAALAVVVAHTGWTNELWGQQGVDVFFIISGFIMMHVSQREGNAGKFLKARAIRIIPLYWAITLIWLIFPPVGKSDPITIQHILLSLAFIPHIGPQGQIWPVVWQGWTLLYEVYFYLLFAMALLIVPNRKLPALSILLGALSLIGLFVPPTSAFAQVYLSPLLLEFVGGAWLHVAWRKGLLPGPLLSSLLALGGLLPFILFREHNPHAMRVLEWGFPALMIVGGSLGAEKIIPRMKIPLLLGNASYAIYLTHRFLLEPSKSLAHQFPTIPALMVVLGISAVVGIAAHFVIERPIAAFFRSQKKHVALQALAPL